MGNNHDSYFGTNNRKFVLLGLAGVGKTTLVNILLHNKPGESKPTKDLDIYDYKHNSYKITLFVPFIKRMWLGETANAFSGCNIL